MPAAPEIMPTFVGPPAPERANRPAGTALRDGAGSFAAALRGGGHGKSPAEKAREAAEEFVSGALVRPILAQLRSTNQASEPFGPGAHERHFATMYDDTVARRIVQSQRLGIVDSIAKTLMQRAEAASQRAGAASRTPIAGEGVSSNG